MKISRLKNRLVGNVLFWCGFIVPALLFISHIIRILTIYTSICSFQYDPSLAPDSDRFLTVNFNRLNEMAEWTDERFVKYHMPNNLSSAVTFKEGTDFTEVEKYHYSDNEALWTGIAYSGWVHKYVSLVKEGKSREEIDKVIKVIENLTSGLAMLMAVPNGGLGSEFPAKLARGYAYPDRDDLKNSVLFEEHPRHFYGTDGSGIKGGVDYSEYRWRSYTSNDEYGGFYLFLSLALKYMINVSPYIKEIVYKIIDQNTAYMLQTNFLGIHALGAPAGPNQLPKFIGTEGFWAALVLKMGAVCFPEKYGRLYYHYIADHILYKSAAESENYQTVANYYAFNFGFNITFSYLLLLSEYSEPYEDKILEQFYNGFESSIWNNVKNHRNAYFNSMYLALQSELFKTDTEAVKLLSYDIQDALMRLDGSHFPDRNYPRRQTLSDIPDFYKEVIEISELNKFLEVSPLGSFYTVLLSEMDLDEYFFTEPLTVEYMRSENFMWERSPYRFHEKLGNNELVEEAGLNLTVPYWITRAHGFMPTFGKRGNL